MCMYYEDRFFAKKDIDCYMVFKKRKFNIFGKRTIRRRLRFWPRNGKLIYGSFKVDRKYKRIDRAGIFSYVSWCPVGVGGNQYEVWLCKIPNGSEVFRNSWEYASDQLEFIRKC